MNVVVAKERRFQLGPDGQVYTDNQNASGYGFWKRYLDVFDSVTVVARLGPPGSNLDGLVTGPGVDFLGLPYYLGPREYLGKVGSIRRRMQEIYASKVGCAAFIGRSPGTIASNLIRVMKKHHHPYGLEVVGDPYDVFAPGAIRHPLRPLLRGYFVSKLKRQCSGASAISYVTRAALQRRYPASAGVFSTDYSSIQLQDQDFARQPRSYARKLTRADVLFVGTLAQLYKAPDVLIEAVSRCRQLGVDVFLKIVGDGAQRAYLETMVARLGLSEQVTFIGQLPAGAEIRKQLDQADLFILPSRGEGLPRALIEAMARGLPCLGTSVSGIPELLSSQDLVPPDDPDALAQAMVAVLSDPARLNLMAERNLRRAQEYCAARLQQRRVAFYSELRDVTLRHLTLDHGMAAYE